MKFKKLLTCAAVALGLMVVQTVSAEIVAPSWNELEKHNETPDWFRDAKFGIYAHWGLYSIPEFSSEWYPRHLHTGQKGVKEFHQKTYGKDFHYHDLIPKFTADKFDANEWAELFKRAGAKFAGPVGEHHDGFSMWDSEHSPFNAANMGPKRDVAGELEQAIRAQGMKFMMSFHHSYNPTFLADAKDPLYSTDKYAQMYGKLPAEAFTKMWFAKLKESVDKYHPELMWFDFGLGAIDNNAVRKYFDYFFKNTDDAVITFKNKKWKGVSIEQLRKIGVEDFERGRLNKLTEYAWLTDDSITNGSWSFTKGMGIKQKEYVLHVLIDIVSKNGQLLLNIAPKADGSIPKNQKDILYFVGDWLKKYGESIYGTRPFVDFGEGPTRLAKSGHFLKEMTFTPEDIRYTTKGNTVYAILLGKPDAAATSKLNFFSTDGLAKDIKVTSISMLGSESAVKWERNSNGIVITAPNNVPEEEAIVYKLETEGMADALTKAVALRAELEAQKAITMNLVTDNILNPEKAIIKGKKLRVEGKKGPKYLGNWKKSSAYATWNVDIDRPGIFSVKGLFACTTDAVLTLSTGEQSIDFIIPATPDLKTFKAVTAQGNLMFKEGAILTFSLKPKSNKKWQPVNVRSLELIWEDEI